MTAARGVIPAPTAQTVIAALSDIFPPPRKPRLDPLDELVLTILSQSTTDANRDRAWASLAERFPSEDARVEARDEGGDPLFGRPGPISWEAVLRCSRSKLESTIRVAGLAAQKAATIHGALERIVAETGSPSLDHLEDLTDEDALEYLATFRGVGIKTAACVLCFSLRRPVLPVDTHVLRIARRLGWITPSTTANKAHTQLAETVPEADRFRTHMLLIAHGREICSARKPRCGECPLDADCPRIGVER